MTWLQSENWDASQEERRVETWEPVIQWEEVGIGLIQGDSALSHRRERCSNVSLQKQQGTTEHPEDTEQTEDWCKELSLTWGERDEVLV